MGSDNAARARQASKALRRDQARLQGNLRTLIVAEGEKTEPNYFLEVRQLLRLPAASVVIHPSADGTDSLKVVNYAERIFSEGDSHKKIAPRAFDAVYAVFDRDDHQYYSQALKRAESLNGKLRNDNKQLIEFKAIPSVPCFEFWLLLHFEEIDHPIDRFEVYERLKHHLPDYEKGSLSTFANTRAGLSEACKRAAALAGKYTPHGGVDPFTAIPDLLLALKVPIER